MGRGRNPTATAALAALVVLAMAVGACSGDDSDKAATTTSAATSMTPPTDSGSSTTTAAAPVTTTAAAKGCPSTHNGGVPQGMASAALGDLDGDGQTDTVYVGVGQGGLRLFGVVTATGSRSEWSVQNASPVDPSVYGVADANQDGQAELFVNPGRIVYVLSLYGCKLQPYLNKSGDPYGFEIGFGAIGTGIGCIDADHDGHRDLVGLNRDPDEVAGKVTWSRTIVRLDENQARNGPKDTGSYQSPADDAAIALLTKVTCGDDAFLTSLTANPG